MLVKAAVCCWAPGLWNEMRRTPEAFQYDWRRFSPNGGLFLGKVFFFPVWGHQTQERWEQKLGCSFFLGENRGGKSGTSRKSEKIGGEVGDVTCFDGI